MTLRRRVTPRMIWRESNEMSWRTVRYREGGGRERGDGEVVVEVVEVLVIVLGREDASK